MSDLEELVKIGHQLADRLEKMAWDEKRFGWEMGNKLEMLAYDTFVIASNLNEISNQMVGGKI